VGVIDISVQPGAGVPLHTNTRETLLWYVISGELTLQTEQGVVKVAADSTSFLPRGSAQGFSNPSDRSTRALLVCIPGGFEGFLLDLSGKLPADVPTGPPPREAVEVMAGIAELYGVKASPGRCGLLKNHLAFRKGPSAAFKTESPRRSVYERRETHAKFEFCTSVRTTKRPWGADPLERLNMRWRPHSS
jgi:hypothetical protein